MSRKIKDDTPKGGWEAGPLDPRPSEKYAAGTKVVRGKLEWVWKPVDAKYLAERAERKADTGKPPESPTIRVRTRKPT